MSEPSQRDSRLDSIARITQILTGVSIIVGIIVALVGLFDTKRQAELSLKAMRLTQLAELESIVAEDREMQDGKIESFLKSLNAEQNAGGDCFENGAFLPAEKMLKKFNGNGHDMYMSDCLADFKSIGRHYDSVGAVVKLGFLDFDFLFDLVTFPDSFWEKSKPYRKTIRKNWRGPEVSEEERELPDFWAGFSYLHDEYEEARERAK